MIHEEPSKFNTQILNSIHQMQSKSIQLPMLTWNKFWISNCPLCHTFMLQQNIDRLLNKSESAVLLNLKHVYLRNTHQLTWKPSMETIFGYRIILNISCKLVFECCLMIKKTNIDRMVVETSSGSNVNDCKSKYDEANTGIILHATVSA